SGKNATFGHSLIFRCRYLKLNYAGGLGPPFLFFLNNFPRTPVIRTSSFVIRHSKWFPPQNRFGSYPSYFNLATANKKVSSNRLQLTVWDTTKIWVLISWVVPIGWQPEIGSYKFVIRTSSFVIRSRSHLKTSSYPSY